MPSQKNQIASSTTKRFYLSTLHWHLARTNLSLFFIFKLFQKCLLLFDFEKAFDSLSFTYMYVYQKLGLSSWFLPLHERNLVLDLSQERKGGMMRGCQVKKSNCFFRYHYLSTLHWHLARTNLSLFFIFNLLLFDFEKAFYSLSFTDTYIRSWVLPPDFCPCMKEIWFKHQKG